MNMLHHLGSALHFPSQVAAGSGTRTAADADPLVQGAEAALQAYTRASDAYTQNLVSPSVALWSVLISAGVVLLEWLLARPGRH
jgi:hypothetical protein